MSQQMSSRRQVLKSIAGCLAAFPAICSAPAATDIQIVEVEPSYDDYQYRAPMKFGGTVVTRVTIQNVRCRVRGRNGKVADGYGSMPMGNVWSFPSKKMTYDQTLDAMRKLSARIAKLTGDEREWGHPIDLNLALEPKYLAAAAEISASLPQPIPKLCMLVTASPFDAAVHDAYGKLHGKNSYQTLGPEYLHHDLSYYLGPEFNGETLDHYILPHAKPELPLYHLVSAVDPITSSDVQHRIDDGLPETLPEWIRYNGITHIKIKLNGDNHEWDLDRVIRVHQATAQTERERKVTDYVYSLDFNEKCPNVDYLVNFLHELKAKSPDGFSRIQYVEQPTARDLKANPQNDMHAASKLVPVVIDESLTGKDAFLLALQMGYSGAALKACKCQSQALLLAALGMKKKVFLCVQDLTCPGESLLQSVSLAAHVPTVQAIEANARQYVPAANKGWQDRFPGVFKVRDGLVHTAGIDGLGLGAVPVKNS
ncbi:MAG TPA: enolase C-terminal domain-like protein [Bryobacteraceae bacterium]|nr:enolase C-terminal domain-like protein [Bryobacteraceae bacterium]